MRTSMQIHHGDEAQEGRPPEQAFTGEVRIGGYFEHAAPSRLAGATVIFEPGARTPWKTNPAGQMLVVLAGAGLAQIEGEAVVEIVAGDTVWIPPCVRHWDGASHDRSMTYVAVHERIDGIGVRFGDPVGEERYG